MRKYGIDISEWQEKVPYKKLASQIDFVILREGKRQEIDDHFLEHVKGFQAAGIPILGVYHFIYALTKEEARLEALSCIRNMEKAGLPGSTRIWADFEYDTVDKAAARGVLLGALECNLFTEIFCETVKAAGYPTGIYTNGDYIENMYYKETLEKYPIWLADYEGEPDYPCMIRQYSSKGKLSGYGDTLDMDYVEEEAVKKTRTEIVGLAQSWVGKKESDGSHRIIIDTYNEQIPLPRGYAVTYTDAWCATFISALAVKLGYTDIIPTECSCVYMIQKAQAMGNWVEDDGYVPLPGDIIFYDWQDNGTGDNKGVADHVGIVEKVGSKNITVIEGNYSDSVKRRVLAINGRYIRGYIVPKYDAEETEVELTDGTDVKGNFQEGLSKRPKWTGRVTASALNVRSWAGTEHPNIKSWPILGFGNLVDVCDSLKAADGSLWYYIRIDGRIYGFVSGKYVVRKI